MADSSSALGRFRQNCQRRDRRRSRQVFTAILVSHLPGSSKFFDSGRLSACQAFRNVSWAAESASSGSWSMRRQSKSTRFLLGSHPSAEHRGYRPPIRDWLPGVSAIAPIISSGRNSDDLVDTNCQETISRSDRCSALLQAGRCSRERRLVPEAGIRPLCCPLRAIWC